jgi:hypothetical protein
MYMYVRIGLRTVDLRQSNVESREEKSVDMKAVMSQSLFRKQCNCIHRPHYGQPTQCPLTDGLASNMQGRRWRSMVMFGSAGDIVRGDGR